MVQQVEVGNHGLVQAFSKHQELCEKKEVQGDISRKTIHGPGQHHPFTLVSSPSEQLTRNITSQTATRSSSSLVLPDAIGTVWEVVTSFKNNMSCLSCRPNIVEYIGQIHSRKKCSRKAGCSPRKSQRLSYNILLLSTVPSAYQCNGDG
jgi:hypothetical protein